MDYSTGNEIVDQMKSLNITGNVIPPIWYKVFNNKEIESEVSGKIRLLAINILADIVYWYRPTEIRDEKTGFVIGYKKKFKADLLQRSYDDLCQMFMCSKKDGQRAVAFLESFGVIKRVFRTLKVSGITVANVLFLQLDVDILKSLTYPDILPYGQNSPYPKTHTSTPKNEIVHTNTENTTQISSKNSFSKKESKDKSFDQIIKDFCKENEELETQLKKYLKMRFAIKKGLSNDIKKENYPEIVPPLKHRGCKTNSIQNTPCTPTPQYNYIDDNYIEYNNIDDNHIEYSKKVSKRETYDEIIENFSQGNKELEAELKKYLQMRFTKQKRLSNVSLKASLNNLLKVSGNNQVDMIEIVNKAVRKEQLDFYPLSEKEKQPKIEQNTSYDLENYNKFVKSPEYFDLLEHSLDKEKSL